jgi:hypothetical protein
MKVWRVLEKGGGISGIIYLYKPIRYSILYIPSQMAVYYQTQDVILKNFLVTLMYW